MSTIGLTNYTYNELLAMLQDIDLRQADYETLDKASAIIDILFHGEKKYSTDELTAMSSQERALYDVLAAKVRSHYYDSLVEAAEGRITNSQLQVFKERAGVATTIVGVALAQFQAMAPAFESIADARSLLGNRFYNFVNKEEEENLREKEG